MPCYGLNELGESGPCLGTVWADTDNPVYYIEINEMWDHERNDVYKALARETFLIRIWYFFISGYPSPRGGVLTGTPRHSSGHSLPTSNAEHGHTVDGWAEGWTQ